ACWILKEIVAGFPAATLPPGAKSITFVTRAAGIVGVAGVELPPPQPAAATATRPSAASRLTRRAPAGATELRRRRLRRRRPRTRRARRRRAGRTRRSRA